jgi:hypothetical protein
LVQCLAPWAVLGALGLRWLGDRIFGLPFWKQRVIRGLWLSGLLGGILIWGFNSRIPGPTWMPWALFMGWTAVVGSCSWALSQRNAPGVIKVLLVAVVAVYWSGYTYAARISDQALGDTVFLKRVPTKITSSIPLMVNADLDSMDLFRILFYLHGLGDQVVPIHNLTFLLDDRIHSENVYVIGRRRDFSKLVKLGVPEVLLQSERSRRERSPEDRLTLFALRFRKNLSRQPAPSYISPMQAMGREAGPYLDSPF